MHDIKLIRDNPDAFDRALAARGAGPQAARLLALDEARRNAVSAAQDAQTRRNALSKEIGRAMAAKDAALAQQLKGEVATLKEAAPALAEAERVALTTLHEALAAVPNLPAADVPIGEDETGNVLYEGNGHPDVPSSRDPRPALRNVESAREHFELGEALGQMDFETAAKLSGARFVVLRGGLARLARALGQFMIDLHVDRHGYTEVAPPLIVRDTAMVGTGQLPKFENDQFRVVAEGAHDAARAWLIPTAEVPLTNLVRESILDFAHLPQRYVALTPCFRAEAGAAGRDTRGMIRQHQFEKVELVSITAPERSEDEHERMLACAEGVLKALGLRYRVVTLCTGDMGFAARKTYDIEVWLPGQGTYREISSCSNCGDFQARRMDARYRPSAGEAPAHVHTLNGSGVAVGRALVAVMETYQEADGGIAVPDVLRPYMGGLARIERAA